MGVKRFSVWIHEGREEESLERTEERRKCPKHQIGSPRVTRDLVVVVVVDP